MNYQDIIYIKSMFPILQRTIENQMGYLVTDMTIKCQPINKKYSHYLEFAAVLTQWTEPATLKTVGIKLYMGRTRSKEFIYLIKSYTYAPDHHFIPTRDYEPMYRQINHAFDNWWWNIHWILTPNYIEQKVGVFKQELISRVIERQNSITSEIDVGTVLQNDMVA